MMFSMRFIAAFLLLSVVPASTSNTAFESISSQAVPNRTPLQPNAFNFLPLGAVIPKGWLKKQLQIQAAGLTGHLDEFWNDVGPNSGWLGGTGESWERGPYYLDGLLPLAYLLNDPILINKAKQWVDWTLTHQQPDGQIGPTANDDWWPRMVMLKVLTQYQEVTHDARVIPVMQKYFAYELRELPSRPLRDWGKYRWQDNAYSVLWLYNRTADKSLLDLARLLHQQGYDWEAEFSHFPYTSKMTREKLGLDDKHPIPEMAMQTHGVNNAMALKAAPIWWLISGNPGDKTEIEHQLTMLDKYHGLPNGMFSGDEHFAGADPSQGIELCAVVESMFSYEQAFAILGDPRLADRLERISYNALPGTLSNDMWSHQYDQQPNQISCTRAKRQWSTNGPDSNLFGLAPNFGCCTANLHQGWPKLVESLWMATNAGGLVTSVYAPNTLHTNISGADVVVDEDTEYPFRGVVHFSLHTGRPVSFPLLLRIPGWSARTTVEINGGTTEVPAPDCEVRLGEAETDNQSCNFPKSFYAVNRIWSDGDQLTVSFSMAPRVTRWFNGAAVFEKGPLVFSLPLREQWSKLKQYQEKSADWQVVSSSVWNYAVEVGDCDAVASDHSLGAVPFDAAASPVTLLVKAKKYSKWTEQENSAAPPPQGPIQSREPLQEITLVPYGAAKLRITEFPALADKSTCEGAKEGASSLHASGPLN
jgi:hypothetical protein